MIALSNGRIVHYDFDKQQVLLTHEIPSKTVQAIASHRGIGCAIDSILASPKIYGYRNKCEFSIGLNAEGKATVGFRLGLFKNGSLRVESPETCVNVSDEMKRVCQLTQQLVDTSELPVYDREAKEGVWRSLLVRQSEATGQIMAMVQANPTGLDASVWEAEKERYRALFRAASPPIDSVYLQEYAGVSAPKEDDPVLHLDGKTIMEKLLGLDFQISPQAFFQVNTQAAEVLYRLVGDLVKVSKTTMLFDVCCGTGTIALCMAAQAGKVIGVEICQAAVEDAKTNKSLNGIENVEFIASKAEAVMGELLKRQRQEDEQDLDQLMAIVDPPRGGLHIDVVRALRACTPLKRIVYVSCNPTGSLIEDVSRLCGPHTASLKGKPFEPTQATPVDLFPHTPHCELVLVLER